MSHTDVSDTMQSYRMHMDANIKDNSPENRVSRFVSHMSSDPGSLIVHLQTHLIGTGTMPEEQL